MKTTRYILATLTLLIVSSINLLAQDSIIDRNVTVEREYKPVIQDAGKINSVPKVLEPTVEKTAPSYSNFNLPLNVDYNIHTLPAAELQREPRKISNGGFARIGFGNNINTLADFAYPIIRNSNTRLDFSLNHLGTFSEKAHSTTKAALSFDKYFKNMDFFAGLGGGHEYLKYYGSNFNRDGNAVGLEPMASAYGTANFREQNLVLVNRSPQTLSLNSIANDSTSNTFWRFNANIGIRSLPMTEGLRYLATVQYNMFDSHDGVREHLIHTSGGFSSNKDKNRMGLDLDMYNMIYASDNPAMLNFWNAYTVFSMNPFYSFERETWNIRLGVKSSFSFVHGKPFNPSADVSAEWKIVPKYFSIYGGITGGYNVNTMDKMFTENRYLFPDVRVKDTYTPYDFFAGIKLKPVYNLLIDGFVDYQRIDNQYFFVNKEYALTNSSVALPGADSAIYTNRFNVLYSGATLLKIGVRANYNLQNRLNIQFKGTYNKWNVTTEEYAWNKPAWESDLSANLRLTRNFSIDGNVYLDGVRYAKLGDEAIKMKPKVDINIGASYTYNNWFTAFAKVNNLINNSYQDYYGYDVQGFNILAGAAFSF